MKEKIYDDLALFIEVARQQSFTRAATILGMSQSTLSQTIRNLEEKLQMRLLSRTTRKVAPTELGEQLLEIISERFEDIEHELNQLRGHAESPSGLIRITASTHSVETILWPKLQPLLEQYPDLKIEISADAVLRDIVAERFDAGVRLGEQIEKDMIALPIGPPMQMSVIGSPDYFEKHGTPKQPKDLVDHECVQIRMPTAQAVLPWEFSRNGEERNVRVSGRIVCNNWAVLMDSVKKGMGLAWVMRDMVRKELEEGSVVPCLEDWCDPFPGFHLYYPSRRQHSRVFKLVIEALKYRP